MFIHHLMWYIHKSNVENFGLFLMYKFKLPYNVITMTTITTKLQPMEKNKLNKRIII